MTSVLYIDDASSMRKLVEMVLGRDYQLTLAENGQEGLDALQLKQFDVIISDVNMPVMDGITFLTEARKLAAYKFTPILMMTTEASPEMKAKGKEGGATGWIVKPFDPQKLPGIIQKVVS
ncbi:response regulator [Thiosulfativibrio zosterae]|uniref:Fis family transcriptional regulator n=1 Tax=Thiosulfativibrio zosterae TaxID=2675053 RepID=A0A6F8PNV9_9GAMM|nr:response regulator [Thiosulfativibrio zosterae]BBP43799.1 Fis family transcriptional regulator [Thiosulfativibrio zosterae]